MKNPKMENTMAQLIMWVFITGLKKRGGNNFKQSINHKLAPEK